MTATSFIYQFLKTIKFKTESFLVCYHCVASSDRFCELRFALPISTACVRTSEMESLPTTKRGGARSKPVQTSKSSLVMAFFSCVAWLYVAGRYAIIVFSKLLLDPSNKSLLIRDSQRDSAVRFQRNGFSLFFCCFGIVRLWQDAENRNLLASLLKKNSAQVFLF